MPRASVRLFLIVAATTLLAACADTSATGPVSPRRPSANVQDSTDSATILSGHQGSQT